MTPPSRRALRDAHEIERAYLRKFERHERDVRERERRRLAALVGPGHNYDLACDAPLGSDPRFDQTGFSDGVI